MKKLIAMTFLLSACGGDIKSKDESVVNNGVAVNNGVVVNNGTGLNNGSTVGTSNNVTTPKDCGNGVLDTTEECEGFDLRNRTCGSEGFVSGTLKCTNRCQIDDSECEKCGNNAIDDGEDCDRRELGGASCESLDQSKVGPLSCNECKFDMDQCEDRITCLKVAECARRCTDYECVLSCVAGATTTASGEKFRVLNICLDENDCYDCSLNDECIDQMCAAQFCKRESDACQAD